MQYCSLSNVAADILPKCVGAPLLQYWFLVLVEQVPRVEHVKEINLSQHWHRSLHEGIVSSCSFFYDELLEKIILFVIQFNLSIH